MFDYPWWTDAHRELMSEADKFVDEVVLPLGERAVYRGQYPEEALRAIAEKGWNGAIIPKAYGGRLEEWGVTGAVIVTEAVSRCGPVGIAFGLTIYGGAHQVLHHGTEEQKQRWLPRIARGELRGSITMTEPYAGSDIAGMETTAVREGDHYVLNGIKRFQTGAGAADLYMTYAKTSDDPAARKKYRHLTGMILEKGMPGFTIERFNNWMGSAGMYNVYMRFNDVKVPLENIIGGPGDGWKVMMGGLNIERALNSAQYLGPMREAIRYAKMHLERRVQFGKPTGAIATNQFKQADLYWKYYLARLVTYYTAHCADLARDVPIDGALAKMLGSDSMFEIASEAIQCMGGNGVMKTYPVERTLGDAKLCQIAAGTNEIMRLVIYRMGGAFLEAGLQAPVRLWDEELKVPLQVGTPPEKQPVRDAADVLRVLAENYRV
ncbi:MAG: acyl-CoA/acyl-ACP dehydrogenase, partial [bacterium]|nr:acyl-CoA/acyl-ACP dehydrogenase [bacterium]